METRLPVSIDAIVAALQTAGLTVWDGPIVTGDYRNAVFIGYDGDPEGEFRAATVDQAWAGVGQRKRNEEPHIIGAVTALVGNSATSWKETRDTAFAMLTTVGQTLRSDPSLGQSPPYVAELWPGEYFQEPIPVGYQARIIFAIHIKTRV